MHLNEYVFAFNYHIWSFIQKNWDKILIDHNNPGKLDDE